MAVKYYTKKENKVGIIDQNILVVNGKATALYLLDSTNYSILSPEAVKRYVDKLENLISTLALNRPGVRFCIYQVNKTQAVEDVKRNLIDTVRLWDPSYEKIPEIYEKYIGKSVETFTVLAVGLDVADVGDVESVSLKDLVKSYFNSAANSLFSVNTVKVDSKRLREVEKSIYDVLSTSCVRTSREFTFYNYISSLFPSYEISYSKNSYVEKNSSEVLGLSLQYFDSGFGYFEMKNTGANVFGYPDVPTYGCVLNVLEMPETINSNRFNLNVPGIRVFVRTLPKDKAKLAVKRARADIEFEKETAEEAKAKDTEYLDEGLDLAQRAIATIDRGGFLCEVKVTILVLSKDLKDLKTKRQNLITRLADVGVFASISPNQGLDYFNNYVKLAPTEYEHLCDLRYPLSFQINNGSQVGDFDSKFATTAIGTDATV